METIIQTPGLFHIAKKIFWYLGIEQEMLKLLNDFYDQANRQKDTKLRWHLNHFVMKKVSLKPITG